MPPPKNSKLWNHFTSLGKQAKCRYCSFCLAYNPSNGTGNLARHMRRKHSNIPLRREKYTPTIEAINTTNEDNINTSASLIPTPPISIPVLPSVSAEIQQPRDMADITFGVLTVSDTCSAGTKTDASGPELQSLIAAAFPNGCVKFSEIVPDEKHQIEWTLTRWSGRGCDVIITTGGTGFSARDVTPEATKAVIDRDAPGFFAVMMNKSLDVTPMAMLSRGVCGIRGRTLIINMPGSVKAARECFGFVKVGLRHAVDLLQGKTREVGDLHSRMQSCDIKSKVKINCVAYRNRISPYPMVEVDAAQNIIMNLMDDASTETIKIEDSLYRLLAEDIYSTDPLPPFPASIKDGYAVISADGAGVRSVRDVLVAGDSPREQPLRNGECIRISTGAAIPAGADAVVQVEDTDLLEASPDGSKELLIDIKVAPKVNQDIRSVGSDIAAGSLVLQAGDFLTSGHIGVLATVGKTKLLVKRRLSIGIVSTGNELQQPGESLRPGCIRDSNKLTLINLLRQYHYVANDCGIALDNPDDVKRKLIAAFASNDVVITTGGVSMGEHDVVKQVLREDFGAVIHFGRVNMKPGKPATFATCSYQSKKKYVFGLPGNPVSASVTSILFVVPALRKYEGAPSFLRELQVTLDQDVRLDPRPEYSRAALDIGDDGTLLARPTGDQISSRLNSFVGAHVLLMLPGKKGDVEVLKKGTPLTAIRIDPFTL